MVEQPAVNRLVVGSSPTCRASSTATKLRSRPVNTRPRGITSGGFCVYWHHWKGLWLSGLSERTVKALNRCHDPPWPRYRAAERARSSPFLCFRSAHQLTAELRSGCGRNRSSDRLHRVRSRLCGAPSLYRQAYGSRTSKLLPNCSANAVYWTRTIPVTWPGLAGRVGCAARVAFDRSIFSRVFRYRTRFSTMLFPYASLGISKPPCSRNRSIRS